MKHARAWLSVLVLLPFAGCLRPLRAPEPPPVVRVAATPGLGLPELPRLKNVCLARALSAAQLMPIGASAEESRKAAFENYYRGFLDAKGQREYIACLEKDGSPEALAKRPAAEKWLKSSQAMADAAMAFFPEEKRIVDVTETFSDLDAKQGLRRVVVTLRDGSKTKIESRYDRLR